MPDSVPAADRRDRWEASAGQTDFPYQFLIFAAGDLRVERLRDGATTELVLDVDYTVTGVGDPQGGLVKLTAGAEDGDIIAIASDQTSERTTAFTDSGGFRATSVDREYDRLWIAIQQLEEKLARQVRAPITDPKGLEYRLPPGSERANKWLRFDENGLPAAAALLVESGSYVVETRAEIASRSFPLEQDAIDTIGYNAASDGGGGIYVKRTVEPSHSGKVQSADGAWWELISPIVSDAAFGGSSTDRIAFQEATRLGIDKQVYGNVVHPAAGLQISSFLTSENPFSVQTTELQAAVDELLSNSRYYFLDLEGRIVTIDHEIVVDENKASGFRLPVTITNGCINADPNFTANAHDAAFVALNSATGGGAQFVRFTDLVLKLGDHTSGVLFEGGQFQCWVHRCHIDEPKAFGVKLTDGGGGLWVKHCDISKSEFNVLQANKTAIGIDLEDAGQDCKITDNIIRYMKTAIQWSDGSVIFTNNHVFSGVTDATQNPQDHGPNILVSARCTSIIANNYIDNGWLEVRETFNINNEFQGYLTVTGNIFTMANAKSTVGHIVWRPNVGGRKLNKINITNNQFRAFLGTGETTKVKPFIVDNTDGGDIASAGPHQDVVIKNNWFWGDIFPQSFQPEVMIELDGSTIYDVDLTENAPFGVHLCNTVQSIAVRANLNSPGGVWFNRTGGFTGNVRLENAITGGTVVAIFDGNTTSAFS